MFKPKKLILRAAAFVVSAFMLMGSTLAYTGTGTVVCNDYLNVRQASNTGSAVIGHLAKGSVINITQSYNGWYKISYSGGSGWVSGQYVRQGGKGQAVATLAQEQYGIRYVFGAASPGAGFDCSGLTMYAYSKIGVTLPHSAAQQSQMGTWVARANLKPGDVVFFDTDGGHNNVTHEGIYIGNNQFVHAQTGSVQKVNISSLDNSYWSSAFMTARRFVG